MRQAVSGSADNAASARSARLGKVTTRSDLFPRLVVMQKLAGAESFAVFRISGSGSAAKQRLVCELDNWSAVQPGQIKLFIEKCGDVLLHHLDRSVLPMAWVSDFTQAPSLASLVPFIMMMDEGTFPDSGIVLPVRLGAIGNGFVVFSGKKIDPKGEVVIDLHTRSCHVMTDLLSLDERRVVATEALSEREIGCLQLAADGRISEEIAEKLGLSVHTVNAYLGSATIKLNSVNRIQAIAKAIRLGYIN